MKEKKKKKQDEFSKAQEPHTLWTMSQAQLPVFWLFYPQFQSSPFLSRHCLLWDMRWPHTHGDNDCWCEGHSLPRTRLSRVCFHHPALPREYLRGVTHEGGSLGFHRSSDVALSQHWLTHTSKALHVIFDSRTRCSLFPPEAEKSPTAYSTKKDDDNIFLPNLDMELLQSSLSEL